MSYIVVARGLVMLCLALVIGIFTGWSVEATEILNSNSACYTYLKNVSVQIQDVMLCLSNHVAPVAYCGWCDKPLAYLKVTLENRTVTNEYGKPCIDLIIEYGREIINTVEFISQSWNRSFCAQCLPESKFSYNQQFSHLLNLNNWPKLVSDRPSLPISSLLEPIYHLESYNDKVNVFFTKLTTTINCLTKFTPMINVSILEVLSFPFNKLNESDIVCEKCAGFYNEMFDFYSSELLRYQLDEDIQEMHYLGSPINRFSVCLDVQYAVNRTEWAWHNLLGCRKEQINIFGFLLPILVCSVFLILFHVLIISVCRKPIHVLVYQPKRVEPRSQSHQLLLNLSNPSRENLIRSYGSIDFTTYTQQRPLENSVKHMTLQCNGHSVNSVRL